MSQELVTIIIPTYNRFYAVQKSIDSVLSQSWKNLEVIVIDDCSTDEKYLKLPNLYIKEPRVKIIRLDMNMREKYNSKFAQGITRNEGIKIAKGEWIGFLDDDDFYIVSDKIEHQIQVMKKYNKQACFTNMFKGYGLDETTYNIPYFNCNIGYIIEEASGIGNEIQSSEGNNISLINAEILSRNNVINNSTVLLHRNIVEHVGLQNLIIAEDYDYWKRCIKFTDFIYLSQPMVGYDVSHAGGSFYVYSD